MKNVIFILADQHNAKCLGYKGDPNVKTPHLDRMAEEGVDFSRAICQNPICTPSRTSWLSGQYCRNHGYYGLEGPRPEGLPTILGHFRRNGYATSAVGKIHCPEYWVEDDCDLFHETCDCSVGGRSKEYAAFLKERQKEGLEDHEGLPEFGERGRQSMEGRVSPLSFEESQEGWIVDRSLAFMDRARKEGRPFFAHLSFPRPHQCTSPSEPFWSLYDESALVLPPNADASPAGRAPHFQKTLARWRRGDWTLFVPRDYEHGRLRKLHGYLAAVSQVDHAVGQVLAYLDRNGMAEDTIVIYSSDHGDYACEHGIMEKAPGICSDAVTRIPMIWRLKGGFKAGHRSDSLVESVDMSATLCRLCGLPDLETGDGKDLSPLLRGEEKTLREIAVTELAFSKSVRMGDYRLVHYPRKMFPKEHPGGFGELYDLAADPWERKNLFFLPEYRELREEMKNRLLDWLITTARPVSTFGAAPRPSSQTILRHGCLVNADGKISPEDLLNENSINYL